MTKPPAVDADRLRRTEFSHLTDSVYLNAASVGPLPERARTAVEEHNLKRARIHELGEAEFLEPLQKAREAAARLIGARPEAIALGGNTSYGINLAALSLPVERGTTALTTDREFPANVYPWMERDDFRLEMVPTRGRGIPDEDALLERLDRGDVSIVTLSAVQFTSGFRADLRRIGEACRARGVFLVVDAIQALGQIPVDVNEMRIDVLATGGHKWLLSPFGTGFAYVREDLIPRMEPRVVGWTGMAASANLESLLDYRWAFHDDARRFEIGTLPVQDFAGFASALDLLLEVGVDAVEIHVGELLRPLEDFLTERPEMEILSERTGHSRSGILAFRPPEPEALHRSLLEAGIVCALREGSIRIAPHLYNTAVEIERVMEVIENAGARS